MNEQKLTPKYAQKGLLNIDLSRYDEQFLSKSLEMRIKDKNFDSVNEYLEFLQSDSLEEKYFLDYLQISYSEFFRNSLTYSTQEHIVLPYIINKKRHSKGKEVRVWSVACALGQEPYSLAMLFEEQSKIANERLSYRIFATDHSTSYVDKAKAGVYRPDNLNNISMQRLKRWFTQKGELFTVKEELKRNIDFSVFDLFDDNLSSPPASIFGDFDIIVCANLLFYYKEEYQSVILNKVGKCLSSGAYLVTGEVEREIIAAKSYNEVYPFSSIFKKLL